MLTCPALAQPPPVRSPPAQGGALGGAPAESTTSLERHDSRGQAVAVSSGHQSVCGGSGSQPGHHHMGPLPSLSGLHLSRFSLRARTRCFFALNYAGWQREMEVASLLFGTQAGHRPSEGLAALAEAAPGCHLLQPACLPAPRPGLRWEGCPAAGQAAAAEKGHLHEEVWGRRREALGKGAVRSQGWLCSHFPGAGKRGEDKPGFSFALGRRTACNRRGSSRQRARPTRSSARTAKIQDICKG